jgi:hypothetical protein
MYGLGESLRLPLCCSKAPAGMSLVPLHIVWLNLDFDWISACDEMWVFMQPGWDTSYGVDREIKFCKKREIPVRFVNEDFTFSGEEPRIYVLPKAVR